MKSGKMTKCLGRLLLATLVLLSLTAGQGICARPALKVAVIPFNMNSPQDLGFLQNGLYSMLSSRLADPGKVDVLERETVEAALAGGSVAGGWTESKARTLGVDLGVNFVLFGSLTHFGESVSLDAKIVDVAGKKPTLSFFKQSNSMGDVIPLVNQFAGDINIKMFNRNISNDLYVQPEAQQPQAPGALQYSGNGGLVNRQPSMGKGFATYMKFKGVLSAMAAGDLNKDGVIQVVTATDQEIQIHELENNHLVLKKTIDAGRTHRISGLDVADINGNGYPEIFVTSINIHREGLNSFVVEYNGSDYVTIADDMAYYLRVMDTADGKVLLGQKVGHHPFNGAIYAMTPSNEGYSRGKRLRLPRNTSVMSLAKGKVSSDAREDFILVNGNGRLVVAGDTGTEEWVGNRRFGGTEHHFLLPPQDSDLTYRERIYLPSRVTFYDLDKDGKKEIITPMNEELGGGAVGRYKRFDNSQMEMLNWTGIGLSPVFSTRPNQGWISDFFIADIDGDGVDELVVSIVGRAKLLIGLGDRTSNVIAYDLE